MNQWSDAHDFNERDRAERSKLLIVGWEEMLGRYPFDVFGTFTFKVETREPGTAIRRTARLLRKFSKGLGDHHPRAFIVAEQHRSGTYHTHTLLVSRAGSELERIAWCRSLAEFAGKMLGVSRVEGFRDEHAVSAYVSKYLVKNPVDWLLLGRPGS